MNRLPLTSNELTRLTNALTAWEALLVADDDYTELGRDISRIEVLRTDGSEEVIGHFVLIDGWVGFQPIGSEQ